MEADPKNVCACKGIRSCLACESIKGAKSSGTTSLNEEEDSVEYIFCPLCGLCWSAKKSVNTCIESKNLGFYLPGILLIHDFISKEEESKIVSNIDKTSWAPSQSGRRKQDFGPKVNFKKHKVKIGDFNGFPEFADFIIDRLASVPCVSSFLPVELCNLEYCPERGSAIEPHVDDFWLWGERLITLNLLSDTVLTLTPMDTHECSTWCKNVNFACEDLLQSKNCEHISKEFFMNTNRKDFHLLLTEGNGEENHSSVSCTDSSMPCEEAVLRNGSCVTVTDNHHICPTSQCLKLTSNPKLKRTVKIPLPPCSLLVLYSCARYHWFHAIKRSDIKDRRLAMTFRELSPEFLPGGQQSELGKELLDIAKIQIKS